MNILSFLGIANAYAAAAASTTKQNLISILPMFIILVLFMYFIIIRPQSKRAKEHRELMASLKTGDEVITSGGLLGKINKISNNFIVLEVAKNVEITMQKASIAATLPKGTIESA
jgi:preprotein translocase subunit YajC